MTAASPRKADPAEPDADGGPARAPRRAYRVTKGERTQALILEAALELFAERGFEATSVRDIAAKVGMAHAGIRLHFGTKENLWRRALAFLFERFAAEMRAEGAGAAGDERREIEAFVHRYVRYCARHPEHVRLMVQASLHANEDLAWSVDNYVAPAHRAITPLFARAIGKGMLPDVPIMSIIYVVSAAGQMIFALAEEAKRIYGVDVLSDEVVERHADAICKLLFAGAPPR